MKYTKLRKGDFIKIITSDETYYGGDIGMVDENILFPTGTVYLLIDWITYKRIPQLAHRLSWIPTDIVERIFRPKNKKERLVFYSACLNGRFADNNKY